MDNTKYRRVLVSGSSGSGKSTLSELLLETLGRGKEIVADLDWFGNHFSPVDGEGTKWIIRQQAVEALFQAPCDVWCFGQGSNLLTSVNYIARPKSHVLGMRTRRAKPTAYAIPWTHRVLIVWDPTDEEFERRFGDDRDNDMGKTPKTRELVRQHALSQYLGKPPRGFVKYDATGEEPLETLNGIVDLVLDLDHSDVEEPGETDSSKQKKSTLADREASLVVGSAQGEPMPRGCDTCEQSRFVVELPFSIDVYEARRYGR